MTLQEPEINYSTATPEEVVKVKALFKLTEGEFLPPLNDRQPNFIETYPTEVFNTGLWLLAKIKDTVVGAIAVFPSRCELAYALVHPDFMEFNIFSKLFSEGEKLLQSKSCTYVQGTFHGPYERAFKLAMAVGGDITESKTLNKYAAITFKKQL